MPAKSGGTHGQILRMFITRQKTPLNFLFSQNANGADMRVRLIPKEIFFKKNVRPADKTWDGIRMTLFKNLSREKKKLYRLAYDLGLTEWHWAAAQILLAVNDFKNAEEFLRKSKPCGS